MWYRFSRWILAKSRDEHLKSIGVGDDVLEFINSIQDQSHIKVYLSALNKNPNTSIEDLKKIPVKNPNEELQVAEKMIKQGFGAYLPQLTKNSDTFTKWYVVQMLKKYRESKINKTESAVMYAILHPSNEGVYHMLDFYETQMNDNPSFNIFNYNFEQIRELSDEWHEVMANKGSGKIYGPIKPENVVYRFKEPSGYTVQKVNTENDLLVEGDRMNHCVGSYFSAVSNGRSTIFSLRDQNNNPLATIELNGEMNTVRQIMANSNSEPNDEIKKLISEWISTMSNIKWAYHSSYIDDQLDELDYSDDLDNELELILKKLKNGKDDYGVPFDHTKNIIPFYKKIIRLYTHENRYYRRDTDRYYGKMYEPAETLARFAVIFDKDILVKYISANQEKMSPEIWNEQSNVNKLNEIRYKNNDKLWDEWLNYDNWTSLPEPDPDDYEDDESYRAALENHEEEEREYNDEIQQEEMKDHMKDHLPYGFDNDISEYLERYIDQEYKDLVEQAVNLQKS